MYLTRKIDKYLQRWRQSSHRCPLLLRGARQVGKTAAVDALGRAFSNQVTADFEADPRLHRMFDGRLQPKSLLADLEVILETRIIPGETLLFFDEVQECPRAIASLRYFKEQLPELHLVAAGSLLEFALGDISFPVGRVEHLFMYPLTFDEFLHATDRSMLAERRPRGCSRNPTWELTTTSAEALEKALREYCVVGGMPAAVMAFRATRSYIEVQKVHDRLVQGFRDDVHKYAHGDLQRRNVGLVFGKLAATVGDQVTYTKLLDDDSKRNKTSVFLLAKAMLVHLVSAASPAGLPLAASADESLFKPVMLDIGLMQRLCGRRPSDTLDADKLAAGFQGQIAEQFVGQELLADGDPTASGRLFYWRRAAKSSSAEVDYLIAEGNGVLPIEVKSGASGRLKSLHLLLATFAGIPYGVCLQTRQDCSSQDQVHFLPLFASMYAR